MAVVSVILDIDLSPTCLNQYFGGCTLILSMPFEA